MPDYYCTILSIKLKIYLFMRVMCGCVCLFISLKSFIVIFGFNKYRIHENSVMRMHINKLKRKQKKKTA